MSPRHRPLDARAANRLLQPIAALHQMKCGEGELALEKAKKPAIPFVNLLRFLVIAATIDLAYALVVKMAYHVSLSRRRSPVRIRSSAPVLDTIIPSCSASSGCFYLVHE